jgi:hypothetical protein
MHCTVNELPVPMKSKQKYLQIEPKENKNLKDKFKKKV